MIPPALSSSRVSSILLAMSMAVVYSLSASRDGDVFVFSENLFCFRFLLVLLVILLRLLWFIVNFKMHTATYRPKSLISCFKFHIRSDVSVIFV